MGEIADQLIDEEMFGEGQDDFLGYKAYRTQEEARRLKYALDKIMALGLTITFQSKSELRFWFKEKEVRLFPYTGWFTGKSIKDGRGIANLLKQLR
jgi:hypothetical protein